MILPKIHYTATRFKSFLLREHAPVILTHCGKMGDFIATLPVASWLYKTRGVKIHFVLARRFRLFEKIESLLMLQDFTDRVTLVDFPVEDWGCGGRPYKFDPNEYGVPCSEYYNLGFRGYPDKFVAQFVAEEHGLSYDENFRLNLGDYPRTDEIVCSEPFIQDEVPAAHCIRFDVPVLDAVRELAGARECYVSQSGPFHILDFAGIRPTVLFQYPHQAGLEVFTRNIGKLNLVKIAREVRLEERQADATLTVPA